MIIKKLNFNASTTSFYFDARFTQLKELAEKKHAVILVDENVFNLHAKKFKGWNVIVLKPGEQYKQQATVDSIITQLIQFNADRKTMLIGVGGGVVTDITGYVASVFMRGIKFGFVPTTLLSMVDASIGGKNGIDVGVYKNIVGTINQPSFILYDLAFLKTLPEIEWQNGFAEIIKHACIKDAAMFKALEANNLKKYQSDKKLLLALIQRNALLKSKVVMADEFETGDRKLLNFGHTFGHAIENTYNLSHGQAVAIGMFVASFLSEIYCGFRETVRVINLIKKYGLPVFLSFEAQKVFDVMVADKKKVGNEINYVLLKKTGNAIIRPLSLLEIEILLMELENKK